MKYGHSNAGAQKSNSKYLLHTTLVETRVVDEISRSRNFAKFREIFISYFAK
jgi:hypothetical protein